LRETAEAPARRGRKSAPAGAAAGVAPADAALLAALREWRLTTAREHGVPAYVVLHDNTLAAIAATRPRTLEALRGISGIGERKLERYGAALLELVTRP